MNKSLTFLPTQVTSLIAHLAWASLELMTDDVEEIQVMAAGDDHDINDLKVEEKDSRLLIEQPTYGLSMKLNTERWMQILIRIPRSWKGAIEGSTIAGPLHARGLSGTDVALDTVSGDLRASSITAIALTLKNIAGVISGQGLEANQMNLRTVSGKVSLHGLSCLNLKVNGVSGDQSIELLRPFEKMDVTTVSGDVEVYAPITQADVALRAVTGRVLTSGVSIVQQGPQVRGTSVSGNLAIHCNQEPTT